MIIASNLMINLRSLANPISGRKTAKEILGTLCGVGESGV
jgi:hypothetical protein